ncbi:MAG: F0F1 ATP synthase subunit A [Clostridiales bacterium]|nr:F0F1 ATP synthase subunit A [Clostridiales bacterium]
MMWLVMAVVIILAVIFTRNLKTIPSGKQNVTEVIVSGINSIIKGNVGHHWKSFAPYFGTLLLFLAFSNIASLFNILPSGEALFKMTGLEFFETLPHFEIAPPTKDLNVTITLAIMSVLLYLFAGIKFKGIRGWLKGFLHPSPVMLPFHILDFGTRTLSLSLRLFGNMLAGYIILEMLYEGLIFVKVLIPVASAFFDIFDALLQAYIFVFLSSIYVSEAIE